jgi:F0F1-type ATP synthase assembly protein I
MQLRRTPYDARQSAFQAIMGGPGFSGLFLVVLATGLGLLLDFQVTGLHPMFSAGLLLIGVPVAHYWTIRRILHMSQRFNPEYMRNMALATVAGQAGCSTLVMIFLALFGGLYLDSRLGTHPVFTIGLVMASIPVSLYAMVRMVLAAVSHIDTTPATRRADGSRAGVERTPSGSTTRSSHTKEKGP